MSGCVGSSCSICARIAAVALTVVSMPSRLKIDLVLRVVETGDRARDAELRLGDLAHDQVVLVVAGNRDHHVRATEAGCFHR